MGRDLITPYKCTEMSTAGLKLSSVRMIKISTANGAYIKTGGTSHIDATRLIFVIQRSSVKAGTGYVYVRSCSTGTAEGFEGVKASTERDLRISFVNSTVAVKRYPQFFIITETARFKDSNGYINFDFSTLISSGGGATHRTLMGAIYVKPT